MNCELDKVNYELNESQREAVLCIDAPSLVIAGAGSGKTRVLTYKIAYLLEQGMQPWNILALTFTNKAAREMRERIAALVSPEKAAKLWMGTFHSIFARILRVEGNRLGYDDNYTIYDSSDSLSLLKLIIREMQLDEKVYKPSAIQNRISAAKNHLVLPSGYASVHEFRESDDYMRRTLTPEIYKRYQERCKQANAMDFDDLLLNTWLLFEQHPEVAAAWQDRFHFVLVDEYQDTNFAQHQIIRQLTDRRQRVCVVGDDAQSIYGFRGANIDNILHFQETYLGVRLFKLERNYRSTQTIVNAAGSLIRYNRGQIAKNVYSEKEVGNPIVLFSAYSDIDEANIILREVKKAHQSGLPYKDIAVLYRTNAQSRKIEDGFLAGRVPYRIYSGMSFYQREEIKDMLCYLRLAVNPYDEESLRRIINKPARGIGDTTVRKLFVAAAEAGMTVWEVLESLSNSKTLSDSPLKGEKPGEFSAKEALPLREGLGGSLAFNAGTLSRLKDFRDMIDGFHQSVATDDAYTLALRIAKESGLQDYIFSGRDPEDLSKQENLQEMVDGIGAFVSDNQEQGLGTSIGDYLQMASLATDFDRNTIDKDADQVNMMTIHSAKGLEFPVVIIAGLEEGLFPSEMTSDSPRELEEERRLFYVALTRAERQVVLTYAKSRFRNGKMEYSSPSRFLREIPQEYYGTPQKSPSPKHSPIPSSPKPIRPLSISSEGEGLSQKRKPSFAELRKEDRKPSFVETLRENHEGRGETLSVGTAVLHERFGRGVVQAIEGTGIDAKATVAFENAGTKVLMLRFAKLRCIS
ncbi:MAG: UvrD-helicase domain-containing protein [Bacteroidaceae bacterium]|nr:UvrD-helicase domain-containing protein [Bacteroidaceae bacterium]